MTLAAAAFDWWPFDNAPPILPKDKPPSVAQFFLQDRLTLGFMRLAIVVLALFILASVPAHIVAGRWIRSFGREGLPVDEQQTGEALQTLWNRLEAVTRERDEARRRVTEALVEARRWRKELTVRLK